MDQTKHTKEILQSTLVERSTLYLFNISQYQKRTKDIYDILAKDWRVILQSFVCYRKKLNTLVIFNLIFCQHLFNKACFIEHREKYISFLTRTPLYNWNIVKRCVAFNLPAQLIFVPSTALPWSLPLVICHYSKTPLL